MARVLKTDKEIFLMNLRAKIKGTLGPNNPNFNNDYYEEHYSTQDWRDACSRWNDQLLRTIEETEHLLKD